jgi:hypothetical protein
MNQEEKRRISEGLRQVIDRAQSLKEQAISPPPPWPSVHAAMNAAHGLFKDGLSVLASACEQYVRQLDGDTRIFLHWQLRLSDLWNRVDILRRLHNDLFCQDYSSLIYHHIFIEEILQPLPKTIRGALSQFVLMPSGGIRVWPIADRLADLAPEWLDEAITTAFEELREKPSVVCFECLRERNFERQAILAHEIMHVAVKRNDLRRKFDKLKTEGEITTVWPPDCSSRVSRRIEELFCDYAAAWFYGPVFLRAFAEEISFYPVHDTGTHPANDLRADFLLKTNHRVRSHRGYQALATYSSIRKRGQPRQSTEKFCEKLRYEFELILRGLDLKPYVHAEKVTEIAWSFMANIPYVVDDIRQLVNNLPESADIGKTRYDDLVSESLRKANLLRQIKPHIRDPGNLFSLPQALTNPALFESRAGSRKDADGQSGSVVGADERRTQFDQSSTQPGGSEGTIPKAGFLSDGEIKKRLKNDLIIHPLIHASAISGCRVDLHLSGVFYEILRSTVDSYDPVQIRTALSTDER